MSIVDEIEKEVKNYIVEYKNVSANHYDFWNEQKKILKRDTIKFAK